MPEAPTEVLQEQATCVQTGKVGKRDKKMHLGPMAMFYPRPTTQDGRVKNHEPGRAGEAKSGPLSPLFFPTSLATRYALYNTKAVEGKEGRDIGELSET